MSEGKCPVLGGHTKHTATPSSTSNQLWWPNQLNLSILNQNSRTPVPQNVLYSIRGWAARAGLLFLSDKFTVRSENQDALAAFAADPGVRPYLRGKQEEDVVRLKSDHTPKRLMGLIRDLGFLIEPEE